MSLGLSILMAAFERHPLIIAVLIVTDRGYNFSFDFFSPHIFVASFLRGQATRGWKQTCSSAIESRNKSNNSQSVEIIVVLFRSACTAGHYMKPFLFQFEWCFDRIGRVWYKFFMHVYIQTKHPTFSPPSHQGADDNYVWYAYAESPKRPKSLVCTPIIWLRTART